MVPYLQQVVLQLQFLLKSGLLVQRRKLVQVLSLPPYHDFLVLGDVQFVRQGLLLEGLRLARDVLVGEVVEH